MTTKGHAMNCYTVSFRLTCLFAAFALLALPAAAAWTYYDNDGSSTYSGTVRNYTGSDKPYHGYITDGTWSIWVYRHDVSANKWTLGAGNFGVDAQGGSARAGGTTLPTGNLDLTDANDAITAATGSTAAFTIMGKRFLYQFNQAFNIVGVPATLETINDYAFKGATGLVVANFTNSVVTSLGYEAFESARSSSEQQFWFPDTLSSIGYHALAWGSDKRSIHFLGDVPTLVDSGNNQDYAIYAGANGRQWAYCVNALKYTRWSAVKKGEFNTAHQSWIPSSVRYPANGYDAPFGTTMFGTVADETYLIQEGEAEASTVPTYSLTAPALTATTAAFGVTLIVLPNGAESATLTVDVATDAAFADVVGTGTVTLYASGATGTVLVENLSASTVFYARISGVDNKGAEGETSEPISFETYLGRDGGYWMSDAPSAEVESVTANHVYYLYSTDGAWAVPIRAVGGVWQLGNNNGNENNTVYDATITDLLDLSSVEADTGIVLISVNGCPFYGKTGIKDVRLPASLEALGEQMFALCSGITNVVMPSALKSLGSSRAFRSCSALHAIDLSGCPAVKTIPSNTFVNSGLTNIDLRATSVTNIADEAFMDNYSLSEVWLPDTLEAIGKNAFAWGPNIRVIHFRNAPPELSDTSNNGPFYPKDNSKRWVYCVDNKAWPAWDALIDSSVPYDSATMRSCLPEGIDESKVIGTTKFGTAGANAILVYEKVKVNNGLFIIVR